MKKLLLLKAAVTSSRAVLGDYELWFQRGLGDVSLHVVEAHAGEPWPSVREFDGVVVTGSPKSVTCAEPWMQRVADAMVEAGDASRGVLGVCFGHQLLAWRHGATVQTSPRGRELGTVTVSLTDRGRESPLFDGFPVSFEVQSTHYDEVVTHASLDVLATSAWCGVHAFQVKPRVYGVQFHPEMDAASIRFCMAAAETTDAERSRAQACATPWGTRLLQRFVELC